MQYIVCPSYVIPMCDSYMGLVYMTTFLFALYYIVSHLYDNSVGLISHDILD